MIEEVSSKFYKCDLCDRRTKAKHGQTQEDVHWDPQYKDWIIDLVTTKVICDNCSSLGGKGYKSNAHKEAELIDDAGPIGPECFGGGDYQ